MIGMFSVLYDNSAFLAFWKWVIEVIWAGCLCQCCGLCLFWNRDDCNTFSKMGFCVSVEGSIVRVYGVSDSKWP